MSNSVSSVVWPWREKMTGTPVVKKTGNPRKSAVIQALVMVVIGFLLYRWLGHRAMGFVVWSLAAVVLVSGFFIPPVFFAIEKFGQWLGRWVGEGLTWALLAPFYYLCFFPGHLILNMKGKDPLHRQFPSNEPTYWVPRKPVKNVSQYRKQF